VWAQAEQKAAARPIETLVDELRNTVGVRLVAYVGGTNTTSTVNAWAEGRQLPDADAEVRLRTAYHAIGILHMRWDAVTIQSWFKGMNPLLDDASPARTVREGPASSYKNVLVAARAAMIE
jgi:hypothetical protein